MIKALVVDDLRDGRKVVSGLLQTFFSEEIELVQQCDSMHTGLAAIQKYKPDLIFLDIKLGDGTGFELVSQSKYKNFDVIFVSVHNDEVIRAFEIGALNYLSKPICEEKFKTAVLKVINNKNKEEHLEKFIEILKERLAGDSPKDVVLPTLGKIHIIKEDDLICCESDGNYTTFKTIQKEKILVSKPIKHYDEILSPNGFIRCHRSYLVNRIHILMFDQKNRLITTTLGYKIPVAYRRLSYVWEKIFDNPKLVYIELSQELELLRADLEWQHIRPSNKLKYEIQETDVAKKKIFIPRILFHPIYENCMKHVFVEEQCQGEVLIILSLADEFIRVSITVTSVGLQKTIDIKELLDSFDIVDNFLKKTTGRKIKITNKKTGVHIIFLMPYKLHKND